MEHSTPVFPGISNHVRAEQGEKQGCNDNPVRDNHCREQVD